MRKYTYTLVAILAIALLALFAFLLPSVEEKAQQQEYEVFLESDQDIASRAEVDDTGIMLGQNFTVSFVVQYRIGEVEPFIESLDFASVDPFDRPRDGRIEYDLLTESVGQYVYEMELMAIEPLNGFEYSIEDILLTYEDLETGKQSTLDISPEFAFQIGQYYGGYAAQVAPRPLKGELAVVMLNKWLWLTVAFSSMVGLVILADRKPKDKPSEDAEIDVLALLITELENFKDHEWLQQDTARNRYLKLQQLACAIAYHFQGLNPQEFLRQDNEFVAILLEVYSGQEVKYGPLEPVVVFLEGMTERGAK